MLTSFRAIFRPHIVVITFASIFLAACDGRPSGPLPNGPTLPQPKSTPPNVDITGQYTLTLLASTNCTSVVDNVSGSSLQFPPSVQKRSYDATMTQREGDLEIVFTPGECRGGHYQGPGICGPLPTNLNCRRRTYPNGGCALGSVSGRQMTFHITPSPATPSCGGGDYWWEQFSATEVFEACGTGRASIDDDSHISGTVVGTFGYVVTPSPRSYRYCGAPDHQFTLTRR
jgi:hypothetical protein